MDMERELRLDRATRSAIGDSLYRGEAPPYVCYRRFLEQQLITAERNPLGGGPPPRNRKSRVLDQPLITAGRQLLLLDFGPGVAQGHGAIKNGPVGRGVGIHAKVAESLELDLGPTLGIGE